MITVKTLIIGIAIIVVSIIIGAIFNNPYPCTESCCGCESLFEMFADTWNDYVAIIGILFGLIFIVYTGREEF